MCCSERMWPGDRKGQSWKRISDYEHLLPEWDRKWGRENWKARLDNLPVTTTSYQQGSVSIFYSVITVLQGISHTTNGLVKQRDLPRTWYNFCTIKNISFWKIKKKKNSGLVEVFKCLNFFFLGYRISHFSDGRFFRRDMKKRIARSDVI